MWGACEQTPTDHTLGPLPTYAAITPPVQKGLLAGDPVTFSGEAERSQHRGLCLKALLAPEPVEPRLPWEGEGALFLPALVGRSWWFDAPPGRSLASMRKCEFLEGAVDSI